MRGVYVLACGALILIVVFAFLKSDFYQFFTYRADRNHGLSDIGLDKIGGLIDAPANNTYFLYAGETDVGSAQIVQNMCRNQPQNQLHYTLDDAAVDLRGCPRTVEIDAGRNIVLFGGPESQPCVEFYETSGQTPAVLRENQTHIWWETSIGEKIGGAETAKYEFDEHHDVFLIEFFVDEYGRNVLVCYGYGSKGTQAAGLYFRDVLYPRLAEYRQAYCIFKWADADSDGVPEISEMNAELPVFLCVQAVLHSAANAALVEWFADICHARDLRITWYVEPTTLNENIASLLKTYVSSGDSVELSFGPVLFNEMEPQTRLDFVDQRFTLFRQIFGRYPELVQSYYVDSYTLFYISLEYPSVMGGVTFVNHEVYADGFKSSGAYYMPYYPSCQNALVPGTNRDKIDLVVLPFLQRDITACILQESICFNLDPQDGEAYTADWRSYFERLLRAYMRGWDQFGLVLYLIDLTYPVVPTETIAEDVDVIHAKTVLDNCSNVLDIEFVSWFKSRYAESPSYRWIYEDPEQRFPVSCWYFTPESRIGRIDARLIESRDYTREYEACYAKAVSPYDNSAE
jgi:hypothetical protein